MTDRGIGERVGAILVAAGASTRMGLDKVWWRLRRRPVLAYPLQTLARCPLIAEIAVAVSGERLAEAERLIEDFAPGARVCPGGARRRDSVANGLALVAGCDWVLVHDAARPFLTDALIRDGLDLVWNPETRGPREWDAAIAAVPVADTIKRARDGVVVETLRREELWAAQTPQIFRTSVLESALESSDEDVTDEATLVERMGGRVALYNGSTSNLKLTTPGDLVWAAQRVAERDRREGLD